VVGDFQGDGRLDLVTVNQGSNDVTFFPDVNSPNTVGHAVPTGGLAPVAALAQDISGNGRMDLVVANNGDGRLSLLTGTPTGLQLTQVVNEPGQHPTALAAAPDKGPSSFWVMNEGAQSPTLVHFDVPQAETAARDSPVSIEEEKAPAELSGSEGEPPDEAHPLNEETTGAVPVLVLARLESSPGTSAHGRQVEADPGETAEHEEAGTAPPAATFLLPDTDSPSEPGASSPVGPLLTPGAAGVQRFILGVDEVPPPLIGPEGRAEAGPETVQQPAPAGHEDSPAERPSSPPTSNDGTAAASASTEEVGAARWPKVLLALVTWGGLLKRRWHHARERLTARRGAAAPERDR
jgi:hypothetical protein